MDWIDNELSLFTVFHADKTLMDGSYEEITGRVCRRLLMLLMGGICLFVAWAMVVAIRGAALESQTQLAMPDGMFYPPGKEVNLRGETSPAQDYTSAVAIWHHEGRDDLGLLRNQPGRNGSSSCYLLIAGTLEQGSSLRIKGMPYTSTAFYETACITEVVLGEKTPVILINANLVLRILKEQDDVETLAISRIDGLSAMGFYVEGKMDAYLWYRKKLRKHFPQIPVIQIAPVSAWQKRTTLAFCQGLGRTGKTKKFISFISAAPDRANTFASEGFSAWLMSTNDSGEALNPSVKSISSLSQVADSLELDIVE